jgi:uncharacterized protein with PIN domain
VRRTAGTAFYLRMLGFDALCQIRGDDQDLPHTSGSQNRILPTRDGSLLSDKKDEVDGEGDEDQNIGCAVRTCPRLLAW